MLPLEDLGLIIVPILFSLTVHEYAHARVAFEFGDPTAKAMGRMSLNPLVHLDLFGTLALIFVGFGWAKPVPVNPMNLKPRRLGDIMVSLAGPLSNLTIALICGVILKLVIKFAPEQSQLIGTLYQMLFFTVAINLMLFSFNLIPLFPLDGHHILREILPAQMRSSFMRWQLGFGRYALLILIVGPNVLSALLKRDVPDPIGVVFSLVLNKVLPLILG